MADEEDPELAALRARKRKALEAQQRTFTAVLYDPNADRERDEDTLALLVLVPKLF